MFNGPGFSEPKATTFGAERKHGREEVERLRGILQEAAETIEEFADLGRSGRSADEQRSGHASGKIDPTQEVENRRFARARLEAARGPADVASESGNTIFDTLGRILREGTDRDGELQVALDEALKPQFPEGATQANLADYRAARDKLKEEMGLNALTARLNQAISRLYDSDPVPIDRRYG